LITLWRCPEAAPLVGCGVKPHIMLQKRFAKGELKKHSTGLFFKREHLASEGVT